MKNCLKQKIRFLGVLLLVAISQISYAQKQVKTYYDSKWKVCKESKAAYYRIANIDEKGKAIGLVKDYYITGELQFEGSFSYIDTTDIRKGVKNGLCTYYEKNGKKSKEANMLGSVYDGLVTFYNDSGIKTSEVHYKLGVFDGNWSTFYENGKLKDSEEFKDGYRAENWLTEWDQSGKCQKVLDEEYIKKGYNNYFEKVDLPNFKSKILVGKGIWLKCKTDTGSSHWITFPLDDTSNFTIETAIKYKSGQEKAIYGIVYGFKDLENHQYFLLNSKGYYLYGSIHDGKKIGMEAWMYSDVINKNSERNRLKIKKRSNKLQFYINGQLMGSLNSQNFEGNFIGLSVPMGPIEVYFENLKVKQDIESLNRE